MPPDDLSCRELVELVTEYLEGVLPPAERNRFEEHLLGCRSCQLYLDQMRLTIRTAGRLTEQTLPAAAQASLLGAFRRWKLTGAPDPSPAQANGQ